APRSSARALAKRAPNNSAAAAEDLEDHRGVPAGVGGQRAVHEQEIGGPLGLVEQLEQAALERAVVDEDQLLVVRHELDGEGVAVRVLDEDRPAAVPDRRTQAHDGVIAAEEDGVAGGALL